METLTSSQRKTFSELLSALPTKAIFEEKGSDEDGKADLAVAIDARAREIMASEKEANREISYKDALIQASEEPQFNSYVSKEE
jgi:hypothetical protein